MVAVRRIPEISAAGAPAQSATERSLSGRLAAHPEYGDDRRPTRPGVSRPLDFVGDLLEQRVALY
jgi:hypothetical protein